MVDKILLTIDTDKGRETFLYDEDKAVKIGDKTYSLENNIFKIYNKSNQLIFFKSYQVQNPDVYRDDYDQLYYITQKQGDYIKQSKGCFPIIKARVPTGVGMDFQKPDRYQTTYNPQDDYIRTQYLGPLQMISYDPFNGTMEKIDPVIDAPSIETSFLNGRQIYTNYNNINFNPDFQQPTPGYQQVDQYQPPIINTDSQYGKYLLNESSNVYFE